MSININNHFHNYVLDVIDTKIYKSTQIIPKKMRKHDSKALEAIRLPKIIVALLKQCPIIYKKKKVSLTSHIN